MVVRAEEGVYYKSVKQFYDFQLTKFTADKNMSELFFVDETDTKITQLNIY